MRGLFWRTGYFIFTLSILLLLITGCFTEKAEVEEEPSSVNRDEEQTPSWTDEDEIVTLRVGAYYNEDDFKRLISDPIQERYSHLEVVQVDFTTFGLNNIKNMHQLGALPDIMLMGDGSPFDFVRNLDIPYPLNDFITDYGINLSHFQSDVISNLDVEYQEQQWLALPYARSFFALYYNKDIFDLFKVPYPTDGMSWEEIALLSSKLSGEMDGVFYRGLEPNHYFILKEQLGLQFIDPESKEILVEDEEWHHFFQFFKNIYYISGNNHFDDLMFGFDFTDKQNIAMLTGYSDFQPLYDAAQLTGMNWDMVSFPTFEDSPHTEPSARVTYLVINQDSLYKEEAFQVTQFLLSEEHQREFTKLGIDGTVLDNPSIYEEYGIENPNLQGKNIQAYFINHGRMRDKYNLYDEYLAFTPDVFELIKKMYTQEIEIIDGQRLLAEHLEEALQQYLLEQHVLDESP